MLTLANPFFFAKHVVGLVHFILFCMSSDPSGSGRVFSFSPEIRTVIRTYIEESLFLTQTYTRRAVFLHPRAGFLIFLFIVFASLQGV